MSSGGGLDRDLASVLFRALLPCPSSLRWVLRRSLMVSPLLLLLLLSPLATAQVPFSVNVPLRRHTGQPMASMASYRLCCPNVLQVLWNGPKGLGVGAPGIFARPCFGVAAVGVRCPGVLCRLLSPPPPPVPVPSLNPSTLSLTSAAWSPGPRPDVRPAVNGPLMSLQPPTSKHYNLTQT